MRAHKRYQPTKKVTFCNVYAHDYCFLAGVYLPRVWWKPKAIEDLAQGKPVEAFYGSTIDEQRANDLFRWLRDFGDRFGWRQTGTLTKLQQEVNQGAIGLIVARRKQDGLSGHMWPSFRKPTRSGHGATREATLSLRCRARQGQRISDTAQERLTGGKVIDSRKADFGFSLTST